MIRFPRPTLPAVAVILPIAGGIALGATAVTAAIAAEWPTVLVATAGAVWAGIAAMWAQRVAAHSCPPRPRVARGEQLIHCTGGPEDGGTYALPDHPRDLHNATLNIQGANYQVTTIDHTCYTAEHTR